MLWLYAINDRRVLGWLTILLIPAMTVACLWPFMAPANTVAWVPGAHAVAFGKYGMLAGSRPLRPNALAGTGCTLDLWVRPDEAEGKGAILATLSPGNPRFLRVEQYEEGLAVRTLAPSDPTRIGGAQLYADDVFAPGKPVLLTIVSDDSETKGFVNGVVRRAVPNFRICRALLTGSLVVGTAADSHAGWRGRLSGMAVFDRLLSPEEIQRDFQAWPKHPGPALGSRAGLIALYLFGEGRGDRVHDEVSGSNSLVIPERYLVLAKRFLSSPSLDNQLDIVANVIGFMPLGFTLCGYLLSCGWRERTGVVATVVLCGVFSLAIEMLQWYLPTRDSDMTDVITNTLGAILGALAYRWIRVRLAVPARKGISL